MTTLTAFYTANPTADITLTWPEDGVAYTVRFGKDAIRTRFVSNPGGNILRDAWVRLVGV